LLADELFIKLSQLSILVPVATGYMSYKELDRSFRLLFGFYVLTIFFEISASWLKMICHNNMPGLHLYTLFEFLAYSAVFFLNFKKNRILSTAIKINAVFFVIIAIADAFVINGIWHHNSLSRTYSSIFLIVYALVYFYLLMVNDGEYYSWQYPLFWVCVGIMIYFGLNLFYFMLNSYLISNEENFANSVMYIHGLINIISNMLFAKSFRCFRQQTTL
jgi:hypothetical protein